MGIAERSERLVVSLVTVGLTAIFHWRWLAVAGLTLLAAATLVTIGQRMVHVHRQVVAAA